MASIVLQFRVPKFRGYSVFKGQFFPVMIILTYFVCFDNISHISLCSPGSGLLGFLNYLLLPAFETKAIIVGNKTHVKRV